MKTSHSGGKIRGREIGCRALKNSSETSSADNESEPEQLFVLAEVTLKLAHLPLTEAAPCVLPDTIVFNILKFCLLLLCITFNNWWKKWGFFFFCWELSSNVVSVLMGRREAAERMSVVWSSSPGDGLVCVWKYSPEHGLPTKQQWAEGLNCLWH